MVEIPVRVVDRVLSKFVREGECLVSTYSVGGHGYPQVGWKGVDKVHMTLCHLVAWTSAYGPIGAGMTVDHRCKNKRCIRVTHLRLLPNLENARRTNGRDWPLGECANGHDDATNWRQPVGGGKGYCHSCRMSIQRDRRSRGLRS